MNFNVVVAETVLERFLGAARSYLMFSRLEIVSVKLEPISDKQFNPFRPAIRKEAVPPYGKVLKFGNLWPKRFKQFVWFKRLWVSPQSTEMAFSSRWKSRCCTIICLSVCL